nr:hypothetical protein [Tanacetum cinerariifolium]
MCPLALRQARRPRSDHGKARHSVASTFAHHNRRSSSHQGDDDDDDSASSVSTPSPTTYLNSLGPLDYQPYDLLTFSEQNNDLLFERQTNLLNQTQQIHKELRGGFKSFGKALIESARATPKVHLPYGMTSPSTSKSDRGKARHSVSSTFSHHNHGSSSHQGDDDEDDDGASRASTPSPTTYLNSLRALDHQPYNILASSEQIDDLLFERQTDLLNQTQQMHKELRGGFKSFGKELQGVFSKKKNAPNAPSKTPSTKGTSSFAIDYTPKSPTSSISPLTNGYFNSPKSPPPKVPPPPPTQENVSMDITLTLSPITPLDVQFDTRLPSPPIFGHLILWNLLEAHGDSCLCCIYNCNLVFWLRDELQCMFAHIEYMFSQPPAPNSPPPPSLSPN